MEEKCVEKIETIAINLTKSYSSSTEVNYFLSSPSKSTTTKPSLNTASSAIYCHKVADNCENLLQAKEIDKASTSRGSMSLLQEEEFETQDSQHVFAEVVLDDETTTSGVLEAYEISSSNLMHHHPSGASAINNDVTSETVAVADDSSSTDAIQIIKVSDSSTGSSSINNEFFNASEVYVINDDDDDDEDEDDEEDEDDDDDEEEDDDEENNVNNVVIDERDDLDEVVEEEDIDENNVEIDDNNQNSDLNNLVIEEDQEVEDVEEDVIEEEEDSMNMTNQSSSRSTQINMSSGGNTTNAINNGVIMSTNGAIIFMETPVVDDQQHHHLLHHHHHHHLPQMSKSSEGISPTNDYSSSDNVKPKRLSDEFSKDSNDLETPTSSSSLSSKQLQIQENDNDTLYSGSGGLSSESSHIFSENERMSSRLKKMNLNNNNNNSNCKTSQDIASSSSSSKSSIIAQPSITLSSLNDIKSMDLIERRDFEHEQRLTGGIILKSSSLIKDDLINLGLVKSSSSSSSSQQMINNDIKSLHALEDHPNTSTGNNHSRGFSSDSKCTYKDLSATPTSSRKLIVRLTKSTAKMNLCNTLSHNQQHPQELKNNQQQQQQHHNINEQQIHNKSIASSTSSHNNNPSFVATSSSSSVSSSSLSLAKSSINSSSSSSNANANATNSTSVIVEPPVASESFSNSNSNDSLTSRPSSTSSAALTQKPSICPNVQSQEAIKIQEYGVGPSTSSSLANTVVNKPPPSTSSVVVRVFENGCSRTSAMQPIISNSNYNTNGHSENPQEEDAQPSTSSARCQYAPPPRNQRQVNASAQTNERYLSARPSGNAISTSNGTETGNIDLVCTNRNGVSVGVGVGSNRRSDLSQSHQLMNGIRMLNDNLVDNSYTFHHQSSSWVDCEENNSDIEEICTCHQSSMDENNSSHGGSISDLNDVDDLVDSSHHVFGKDCGGGGGGCGGGGDFSYNIMQNLSISEDNATNTSEFNVTRKRKYNDSRLMDHDYNSTASAISGSGGVSLSTESNSRKRIAYDFTSTPRSSQNNNNNSNNGCSLVHVGTPTAATTAAHLVAAVSGSPLGRRTPRSLIPTRDNPPPELQQWLVQFQRWSHAERLLAVDRLIEHCEPTQVRHMMKVIEPQFQRDFISLLPRELALQVLSYLDPKDLLRAAQTCRSWRFLCDDNLLWKEKCRTGQILTEPRTDRPKRGRAGNMPPIASPWKAAYMRQHIIEMNWRSRPIRQPKVLKGHDEHVITCLQFSGNRIVSGSDDNTLKVWSAVTGRCLRTLVGHTGGVWSSQMSGNIIISGSTDRTLKVWDMETGQCVHTLLGHTSTVRCMHLHGNKVVSGSRDATLRVWDIEQGTCSRVLVGHLAAVRCVQYDGKLIVSGAYDYMVKIWHPERSECLHTLQGHTNRVYSLQFDGAHVVSGSLDTSIRVWDVETGNCKHTLMGHQSLTSGMELRENILVSGNADSTVKVWDITTGQCLQTLSGPNKHQSAVTCLQFNSRFVVTSSDDGTVKLWDVKTGEFIRNLVSLDSGGSGGVVWRIRANDTKLICAVGSRNGTEETKLMVLDFDVKGACVKCS